MMVNLSFCKTLRLRNEATILLFFVLIGMLVVVLVVPPEMFADEHAKHALPGQRIIMVSYIFGTSNAYVQLFLESARRSGVDVAIVGSPKPAFPLPPNVRHFPSRGISLLIEYHPVFSTERIYQNSERQTDTR